MYPRSFDYVAASSLDEAIGALGDDSKVIAGGMSLLPLMKMRLLSPGTLVDIAGISGLDNIEDKGDHISIGAMVRHAQTASSETIPAALATAAALTGDKQIRNRGTTCGSMAHVDIAADTPAAVLALGGTVVARGPDGERSINGGDFCVDTLTSALGTDEILTEIRIPKKGAGEGSAYDKLGRRGGQSDYAVAGAAAWIKKSNGTIEAARVALTGVGTKPTLIGAVGDALVGTDGSDAAIDAAAAKAVEGVTVLEDLYGSVEYKTHLAKVYTARAIKQALANV